MTRLQRLGPIRLIVFYLASVLLVATIACSSDSGSADIEVSGAWMRAGLDPTAAYMVISNQGGADDAYLSATTDLSPEAQLHSTVKDGDFVAMEEVERLPIPARGTVELRPAGLHLMVSDFSRVLEAGETVAITLNFEKSGAVHVDAQIRAK